MIGVERYPKNLEALRFGWRRYRIVGNRLRSPLAPMIGKQVYLGDDGSLRDVFIVPEADNIWPMACMIEHQRWYPYAMTFGAVQGPFAKDPDMPRIGSVKVGHYQALSIFTEHDADLEHYGLPIYRNFDLEVLHSVEISMSATKAGV